MATSETPDLETMLAEALPIWIERQPELRRQLHRVLTLEPSFSPRRLTYDEFLQWADEDTLAEWVNGEVTMTSPASLQHQFLAIFLERLIGQFVESRNLGIVLVAPFQMKLPFSGREPDLLFVASAHLDRLRPTFLDGPADLVVEIASPESIERDRGAKFTEYEASGVSEYWLLDPIREQAEFYRLNERGRYRALGPDQKGRCHARVIPGFWLQVDWLWQQPLPSPLQALAEIAGVEPKTFSAFWEALIKP